MKQQCIIELSGQEVRLLGGGGMIWPEGGVLFIADTHFGKGATFRRSGLPVPEETHEQDLARLTKLLQETGATKLVILGDFFHARRGRDATTLRSLTHWRSAWTDLSVLLIAGNHDRAAGAPDASLQIQYEHGPYRLGPFVLHHEPPEHVGDIVDDSFHLCGHLHPTYRLGTLTARCFYRQKKLLIFPSFGSFTGGKRVRLARGEQVYLVGEDEVIPLRTES